MIRAYFIRSFKDVSQGDLSLVGGKNAALGEMIQHLSESGVYVPDGFAVTTDAYWRFVEQNKIMRKVQKQLKYLDDGHISLQEAGSQIRTYFLSGKMPPDLHSEIKEAYRALCRQSSEKELPVAIRSSATAEDLPDASFAGQQESFLNVRGEQAVIEACQKCFASLFTNRAISYRKLHGIDHMKVALSIGVQLMVSSDKACSGVMFSIDTETGFPKVVVINATWGLGEGIVSGKFDPDEYVVYKPFLSNSSLMPIIEKKLGRKQGKVIYKKAAAGGTDTAPTTEKEKATFVLNDEEIVTLARSAERIEKHYARPMDMEWAKDFKTNKLYILQARPETVQSKKKTEEFWSYKLLEKGPVLTKGLSIGDSIATGSVWILENISDAASFPEGAVLVTPRTDPDWLPVMLKASALVTDHGGRTSHAAIVSRELGLPAVVGTGDACKRLKRGQMVTVSCAEGGQGYVYDGRLPFERRRQSLENLQKTHTKVMLNVANPDTVSRWWRLPTDGIGLARMEFIIGHHLRVHPRALLHPDNITSQETRTLIDMMTRWYATKEDYFIEKLSLGIAQIAASQYPKPVIVRLSDFKTNEYANLVGGRDFEPEENNPMIGWRGASRYYHQDYRDAFALECRALRRVREVVGFMNIIIMVPFCRTVAEADAVLKEMAKHGLERGKNGLEVYVMAEVPSNILRAEDFSDRFDGFSIGSNDLTQLTLGIDRDSDRLKDIFNASDPAVTGLICDLIRRAHAKGVPVGFCGQAPSDDPEYVKILVDAGIDSISVTPDSFIAVKENILAAEKECETGLKKMN